MKENKRNSFDNDALEKRLAASRELSPSDDLKARILSRVSKGTEGKAAIIIPAPNIETNGESKASKRAFLTRMATLAATFLIFVAISFAFVYTYALEADVVYIDVNPSLELSLNRRNTIIRVKYLNEDARALFEEVDLKGKNMDDGLEIIMQALDSGGYMEKEDSEVYIAVYSDNEKKASQRLSELASGVAECEKKHDREPTINTIEVDRNDKKQSGQKGISPNKYHFIKEILELSDDNTEEELSEMSVKELRRLCNSLREDADLPPIGDRDDKNDDHDDRDDDRDDDREDQDDLDDREEEDDLDDRDDRDDDREEDDHDDREDHDDPEKNDEDELDGKADSEDDRKKEGDRPMSDGNGYGHEQDLEFDHDDCKEEESLAKLFDQDLRDIREDPIYVMKAFD